MSEVTLYRIVLVGYVATAVITFVVLNLVDAPYGRHIGKVWQGPTITNRAAWLLMEAPAAVVFGTCFVLGPYRNTLAALVFCVLWESHYLYRAFIYPFRLRGSGKRMPVMVAALGFIFNVLNGYLNGRYLFSFSGGYSNRWLLDPRFLLGALFFVAGMAICRHSDAILRRLRPHGQSGYQIPRAGLFAFVSAPNYLGEIIEWGGWALATWSVPGAAFFLWVLANLVPRARANHRWYRQIFPKYPKERRALLPGIW
jgi:protein-S-isoprenylcysteine O-methyltransferase Ste14